MPAWRWTAILTWCAISRDHGRTEPRTRRSCATGYWCIAPHTAPDRFLGWVLLIPRDAVGPEIEIGWRLVQTAWGHGYASEAAAPIVRHGFETAGLDRIIAEIHPEHVRSHRVAEKLGLRRARAGKLLHYELTRDRFLG
jgi:RimJ/RimL family protein N-acetyltransferase